MRVLTRIPTRLSQTPIRYIPKEYPNAIKLADRLMGTAKKAMNTANKVANTVGKARKTYTRVKKEVVDPIMNFGSTVSHSLHAIRSAGKRMKMPLYGGVIDCPATGDITESFYSSVHKGRVASSIKLSAKTTYIVDNAFEVSCGNGQQGFNDLCFNSGGTSIAAGAAAIYNGNVSSLTGVINNGFKVMPNFGASGTARGYLDQCMQEIIITNAGNAPCIMELYEVVAKHDLGSIPNVTSSNIYSPSAFWVAGLANSNSNAATPIGQNASGSGQEVATNIGSRPFDSQLFNDYWRVASRHTITMASGSSHRHKSVYKPRQIINASRYLNSALIGGLTRSVLFVIRGINGYDVTRSGVISASAKCWISVNQKYIAYSYANSGNNVYTSEFNPVFNGTNTTDVVNVETTNNPTYTAESANP